MPELPLPGCTPEPLMGYLKALGVFRLVAEQADPAARGHWAGSEFVLDSARDGDALMEFFLTQYSPTPVLAPWNGGSGFYGGGSAPLNAIAAAETPRLSRYREAIRAVRTFVPDDKPKDADKEQLLVRCRAELEDDIVPWLDTCFVLGQQGPSYFPLLGTGGNDGRLDFTNNFMQRLADIIPFSAGDRPPEQSADYLRASLFAEGLVALDRAAVGQFNPGGVGGANGVQGKFEADSRVNPWDFVFMIEGALLFAGSVARRLGANAGDRAAFPFTVQSVAIGYGSATASEETTDGSRAELWLPLWQKPAALSEVSQLFAEGRAQFGRRQARNAVEFALAINLLGVDRGVTAFARYGFLKRNGLAFLATPLGRVPVTPRPTARLLDDPKLTEWLERLRTACREKDKTPARYQTALRTIDRAIFQFANRSQTDEAADKRELLNVLAALGRAERTLSVGLAFCEKKGLRPLQGLRPAWLLIAPDGEAGREFRLAAALASVLAERDKDVGPLRVHLEPVAVKGRSVAWSRGSTSAVWSNRPLADNLAAVFLRRWLESEREGVEGLALRARVPAPLADVAAFINGHIDSEVLTDLLWGLIGLDWTGRWFREAGNHRDLIRRFRLTEKPSLAPSFGLARLVVRPVRLTTDGAGDETTWRVVRKGEPPAVTTTPTAEPFHQLRRRDPTRAADAAARRLWADGIVPFGWGNRYRRRGAERPDAVLDPVRLLAACLFPLSSNSLTHLARQVLAPPVPVG